MTVRERGGIARQQGGNGAEALRGLDTGAAEAIDRRIEAAFETKPNEIAMPSPARA